MTITTKENAQGKVSGYYVDGRRVKKSDIEALIGDAAREGKIIEADYYTAQAFKAITRTPYSNMKLALTHQTAGVVMTETAANELGATVGKRFTTFNFLGVKLYRVEMPSNTDAQQIAIDTEQLLADNNADVKEENTMRIEETKKVASAEEAIAIINELNYTGATFTYVRSFFSEDRTDERRYFKAQGKYAPPAVFAILEIVKDGKLQAVKVLRGGDSTVEITFGGNDTFTTETDGSEDDSTDDNTFEFIPDVDELNSVDIDDNDEADIIEAEYFLADDELLHAFIRANNELEQIDRELADAIKYDKDYQHLADKYLQTSKRVGRLQRMIANITPDNEADPEQHVEADIND